MQEEFKNFAFLEEKQIVFRVFFFSKLRKLNFNFLRLNIFIITANKNQVVPDSLWKEITFVRFLAS